MQKFVDRKGRVWVVDLDNTALRRVKTITGVSLMDALDGELVAKLASDPLLLGDVLYAVCKPQADKEDVTDEQFGEGLAGDSIAEATNALIEAIVAYLPEQKRRLMKKAAEKQRQIETRGLAAVEKHLDDPNLVDRIVQDLETNLQASALNASSSDSPASSESTQGH